jgi:hypothetical protein
MAPLRAAGMRVNKRKKDLQVEQLSIGSERWCDIWSVEAGLVVSDLGLEGA